MIVHIRGMTNKFDDGPCREGTGHMYTVHRPCPFSENGPSKYLTGAASYVGKILDECLYERRHL